MPAHRDTVSTPLCECSIVPRAVPEAPRWVRSLLIAAVVCYLASLAAPTWRLAGGATLSGLEVISHGIVRADRIVLVHLLELVAAIWIATGRRRNALIALTLVGAYAVLDPLCIVLEDALAFPHAGYALWITSIACLVVAARRLPRPQPGIGPT